MNWKGAKALATLVFGGNGQHLTKSDTNFDDRLAF